MTADTLDQQVQRAQERLRALYSRVQPPVQQEVLDEALEELSISLHELQVSAEELRNQAEALASSRDALEAERQRYQELFEFAPDGYFITDRNLCIREANVLAAKLLGVRRDSLIGKPLSVFIGREHRAPMRELVHGVFTCREQVCVEMLLEPRDRPPFPADVMIAPLWNRQGAVLGFRLSIRDISRLKEAESQVLQSERLAAIGQMATGLTHETRNAIQRSKACLEILALEVGDRPQALELVARVQRAQNDLHALHEEVRQYAAPFTPQRQSCSVTSVLRQAWDDLEFARAGRQATLREHQADLDLHCEIDRFLVAQVFSNILKNSLDACPDPAEIEIDWSSDEIDGVSALRIAIRDNGPGLSPEQLENLFTPFFTTKTHGTGLGMAIAKRIIDAHAGRIAATRQAVGGAEIVISLPRQAFTPLQAPGQSPIVGAGSDQQASIRWHLRAREGCQAP